MPDESGTGDAIVFLDRDGTVSGDRGYTCRPSDMHVFTGAGRAVGDLQRAGFRVVIVTNQSVIGRGLASTEEVVATNDECLRQLRLEDDSAIVDAVRFCPHLPEAACDCRKPRPGMVLSKSFPLPFAAARSWMVGDKTIDQQFGMALGIAPEHCILVRTGDGRGEILLPGAVAAIDLAAAVAHILASPSRAERE